MKLISQLRVDILKANQQIHQDRQDLVYNINSLEKKKDKYKQLSIKLKKEIPVFEQHLELQMKKHRELKESMSRSKSTNH